MAATVANLTLVAGKVGKMGAIYAGITSRPAYFSLAGILTARWSAIVLGQRLPLTLTTSVCYHNRSLQQRFSSALLGGSGMDDVRVGLFGLGHRGLGWLRLIQTIPGFRP